MSSKIFYRDLNRTYPIAVRGSGIYIYDKEGKEYLDGSSGALVVNVGHGNKEIIEAVYEQMNKLSFAHTSQFQTEVLIEYAEMLAKEAPGELNYAYFVAGGSEGVDTAIKLARQYHVEQGATSKHKVIGRWTSFHGHTLGALSAGGYSYWRDPQTPNLIPFPHIQSPLCYHCPFGLTPETCQTQCALELEQTVLREGPDNIAAFIFEPIIGSSSSAVIAPDPYYKIIEEICRKYDILLIADEVMCGFGRTGEIFAVNHWGVQPDLIVSGKGISSGYAPLGLVMVHQKIYDTIKNGSGRFLHGFTSSGNPVSVAAGLAVLKFMQTHHLPQKAKRLGDYLQKELEKLKKQYVFIGDIRGKGLMWGIEFVANRSSREPYPPTLNLTSKIVQECFANGLIVYPSQKFLWGTTGDSIMIAPPLIISKQEMDELLDRLSLSLQKIYHSL